MCLLHPHIDRSLVVLLSKLPWTTTTTKRSPSRDAELGTSSRQAESNVGALQQREKGCREDAGEGWR